jgi:hypothetical protein
MSNKMGHYDMKKTWAVPHVPQINRNLSSHCRRCGKLYKKQTRCTTLCDECWLNSNRAARGNVNNAKRVICKLCGQPIEIEEERMSLTHEHRDQKFKASGAFQRERKDLFHLTCYQEKVMPHIAKITRKIIPLIDLNQKRVLSGKKAISAVNAQ